MRGPESIESGRVTMLRKDPETAPQPSQLDPPRPIWQEAPRGSTASPATTRAANRRRGMVKLAKALPFGIFLTILVCLFIGSGGSTGGVLNIRSFHIAFMDFDVKLYWSWAMFIGGTGLTWVILLMMGD